MSFSPINNRFARMICLLVGVLFTFSGCSVKPRPISRNDLIHGIANDRRDMYSDQEPLAAPLTLYEAIARALKYNYDHRLSMMEMVLQQKQLKTASVNMLPKLATSAGYNWRNNNQASFSVPVDGEAEQGNYFTSQDRKKILADLSFSWNILDFGVSYFQAKQQANRVLIAQERRRRVINNIIKEVSASFWQAYTAQELLPEIEEALREAVLALEANREIEQKRLQPILETLQYRKDLLKITEQLQKVAFDLQISKVRLASMINLPLHQPFLVAPPDSSMLQPPRITVGIGELEAIGLYNRADLREAVYLDRIDRDEVHKEIIKLFPGTTLSASQNYDSNSFFQNSAWVGAGLRFSYDLVNLIFAQQKIDAAKSRLDVGRMRRLSLTVAGLIQINISYQQYMRALESYQVAAELNDVESRLQQATRDASALQARSKLDLISQQAAAIAARLDRDNSLAETMTSLYNLYVSLGCDPYIGPLADQIPLETLTRQVKTNMDVWHMGYVTFPVIETPNTESKE